MGGEGEGHPERALVPRQCRHGVPAVRQIQLPPGQARHLASQGDVRRNLFLFFYFLFFVLANQGDVAKAFFFFFFFFLGLLANQDDVRRSFFYFFIIIIIIFLLVTYLS